MERRKQSTETVVLRTRLPGQKEIFAIVEQRLGYNKMYVRCLDNKIRIGRIPGKYSKGLWIREGDLVLVTPWVIEGDKKADVIYRYKPAEWDWLIANKHIPAEFR